VTDEELIELEARLDAEADEMDLAEARSYYVSNTLNWSLALDALDEANANANDLSAALLGLSHNALGKCWCVAGLSHNVQCIFAKAVIAKYEELKKS